MYADDIRADKEKQRIDNLGNLFSSFELPKSNHKTPQAELIEEFREELNSERKGTKYRPLSFMGVRTKLHAIANDTHELKRYLSECRDYKNRNGSFSKRFFGGLK